jgi:hypothetical protein
VLEVVPNACTATGDLVETEQPVAVERFRCLQRGAAVGRVPEREENGLWH